MFCLVLTFMSAFSAYSANPTKEELSSKIEDVNAEIMRLDTEIAKYEVEIVKTGAEAKTLSNHIKELNLTRNKLLKEAEQIASQIKLADKTISNLSENILTKEEQINLANKTLAKTFYDLYQSESIYPIEMILKEGKLSSFSKDYNEKILLSNKIDTFISEINSIKINLEESKGAKEIEREKLNKLNQKLSLEKEAVTAVRVEKDKLLKETKNQESAYQKLLAENKKKREAFEKDLRDYETQLKFILDSNLLPVIGSAPLSWPMQKIFITQLFGKTASSARLYASGSHSGVDFGIPIGTPVYAIASGTVIGVGDTDANCKGASFGKWVFIKYNNGLSSTYGHLSAISAKEGQEVKTGDLVALSGNTGHSTGPHLHLTVYASQGAEVREVPTKSAYCKGVNLRMPIAPVNAYLDPMSYLPKTTASMYKKGI